MIVVSERELVLPERDSGALQSHSLGGIWTMKHIMESWKRYLSEGQEGIDEIVGDTVTFLVEQMYSLDLPQEVMDEFEAEVKTMLGDHLTPIILKMLQTGQ